MGITPVEDGFRMLGEAAGFPRFRFQKMNVAAARIATIASAAEPQVHGCQLPVCAGAATGVQSSRPINRGAFSGTRRGCAAAGS